MKGLRLINNICDIIINIFYFYLVTWMKGLRRSPGRPQSGRPRPWIFTLWPEWRDYDTGLCLRNVFPIFQFLPCDLNEGITTVLFQALQALETVYFYLVTWMKGLRLDKPNGMFKRYASNFYLVTWMKGLRLITIKLLKILFNLIFTLWPEWRDYD